MNFNFNNIWIQKFIKPNLFSLSVFLLLLVYHCILLVHFLRFIFSFNNSYFIANTAERIALRDNVGFSYNVDCACICFVDLSFSINKHGMDATWQMIFVSCFFVATFILAVVVWGQSTHCCFLHIFSGPVTQKYNNPKERNEIVF